MDNHQHMERILKKLEKDFDPNVVYDYFSAFYDVTVLGHSSHPDDNPHEPHEQPSHRLYKAGAVAAEELISLLNDSGKQ